MAEFYGTYECGAHRDAGAMGQIFEGRAPDGSRVAIKTLPLPASDHEDDLELLLRFRREAATLRQLTVPVSHPNVVKFLDYGETTQAAYIIMELVDGPTLKKLFDQNQRFDLPETMRLMQGVLAGLQHSHDRGVVHRDIKPSNIMLGADRTVKIIDYGVVRVESSVMTQVGTQIGTPAYMSPEQWRGQPVTASTDLYTCGVLLYELLTGEKPFAGGQLAIMHKALHEEPSPPSRLTGGGTMFDEVVRRAMAKNPADRYESAAAFADALQTAFENRTMRTPPPARPPEPRTAVGTTTLTATKPPLALYGGLVAGLVVLLLGAAVAWHFLATPAPAPVVAAPPPPTAAQTEATLAGLLDNLPCTLLEVSSQGGSMVLSGLAGAGAPQTALTNALGTLPPNLTPISNVQTMSGPYCSVLDTIRPAAPFTGPGALMLTVGHGEAVFHDKDQVTVSAAMPGIVMNPANLQTFYISGISFGDLGLQPATNALTTRIQLDGPATDLVISIATTAPLFSGPKPPAGNLSDLLAALQPALQFAEANHTVMGVAAVPVIIIQ
jgi:serine/threonine-protein kinase